MLSKRGEGNRIPQSYDTTDAFFDRINIFNFPKTFPKDEEKKQELLKTFEEEKSGILNEALKGLQRLRANKQISNAKAIEDIRHDYMMKSDSCQAFIEKALEIDLLHYSTLKSEVYTAYATFCHGSGLNTKSHHALTKALAGLGIECKSTSINGKKGWYYIGVKVKELTSYPEDKEEEWKGDYV